MRAISLAVLMVVLGATSSQAQCFGGYCRPFASGVRVSVFAAPYFPPSYSYGYSYYSWYTFAPPPVVAFPLAPPRGSFEFADDTPTGGGVDLAALRQKLAKERDAEERAKGRVDSAVKNGDLVVFEPGKPLPKRAEVPPVKIPDAPKVADKLPVEPAALAKFHLRRGQEAFDAGEFGRATERFAAAVAANPKLSEAAFKLAQVRAARGQYAEAVDAIRDGMKANPDWASANFRPADLYALNPKRQATDVAELKAAWEAAPADTTLSFLLAHQTWFAGDHAGATELFRKLDGKVKERELVEPFLK